MSQQNDYKWNDYTLTAREVGEIESPERLTDLFHRLRYHVDAAGHVDHMVLRLDSDDLRHQVTSLYKIATDPDNEEIEVYLLEVRSVTQALIQELTRRLRSLPKSYLLVLTQDYERLNFVLLERVLTERKTGTASILRPRVLTVDRRNPDAVSLRVLKRFTFTEADALYQWEKLRGAYALAEWSEQYFNNRALFSDYYLNERLTDQQITPAWAEDARPMGREVAGLMASAREKFSGKPEVTIRSELYEPLFELLGFEATVGKVGSSSADTPDYYLFLPGQDKPIALALTYVWNRNLDDHDTTRDSQTPTEIPGAMVVSFLERAEAPWVIVTNGKLWRLYSATAGNKATNYYEVDLEEALTAPDQVTAFKYWWLMFRREAFTGFLDELLAASVDYAKKLGDSLKSTVFESIFPYFAAGFIEDMRKQGVGEKDIETCLGLVYTGTLTFLYRLMFQLYAESLELLPVKELTGYGSWSLYLLKKQVAEAGGDALDAAPRKLAEHYSAESQELYDWLKWLFRLIDQGEPKINLPTYNGGLFSASTDEGQFLEQYAIPDRYLALGLDALCRAEDDKTHGLAMIDFKSLGVRQLGSIYEGLLEFRLHIAGEPLAVIREKKKEVYISEKEAQKRKKRVLKVLQPGDVYLENDKRERKATGSYYTPDYIVKYIVEHTVGPVLDRKFEALAPRLREAQKAYRHHTDTVKARGGDQSPELFWDTHEMRRLADDCLSVRVLDPAMGSGHFLVEVVDYVSNRLIDFLNAWGENPVWALLERTREDIIEEVQRQHVTVDFDRLTRVALLKRAVLKRCVYGVDLNPMAVELAKVSLWLDAFTLGAPLSFLDHHLKCGNSLIGARVSEVQDYLAAREGQSYDMFASSRFAGVMLATDLMRQVSYLSDNTVSQVQESQQAYHSASDHLAPFKRILDVYTSRWFGNAPQKRRGAHEYEPARELINHAKAEAWLKDPHANPMPKDYMDAKSVAEIVLTAADEKRFFHWELEFPEVFFAPSMPGGQDVQLREDGGFSAVVGNPPYGDVLQADEKNFIEAISGIQTGGRAEIYANFMILALSLLMSDSRVAYIVQNTMLDGAQFAEFRRYISGNSVIEGIRDYRNFKVFSEAETLTMIILLRKFMPPSKQELVTEYWAGAAGLLKGPMRIISGSPDPWRVTDPILDRILSPHISLRLEPDLGSCHDAGVDYKHKNVGWQNRGDNPKLSEFLFYSGKRKDMRDYTLIKGADFDRYYIGFEDNYLVHDWEKLRSGETVVQVYLDLALIPTKILTRQTSDRIQATIDRDQHVTAKSVHTTIIKNELYTPEYVISVLNSALIDYVYRIQTGETGRTFAQVKLYDLRPLPIRKVDFNTPSDIRTSYLHKLTVLYKQSQYAILPALTQDELDTGRSDVIHDFLAYLAEQMIDLNKQKQAEVSRFLGWLEGTLKTQPSKGSETGIEAFAGKSIIQNYLGDYQKGEPELPWSDFEYRLHQNRNRFKAGLTDLKGIIRTEYEKSLAVLLPIKQRLGQTDRLIDQIVYQLYGLTDEEIELIERPQYEQTVAEAKQEAATKEEYKDDPEAAFEYVAAQIEPAAARLAVMSPSVAAEASLDAASPGWRSLPERAQILLSAAERDYLDETRLDYTGSEINYAKAVEVTLTERLFVPFRDAGYGETDVINEIAFKPFMRGEKALTLGNFPFLFSRKETTFLGFIDTRYPDARRRVDGIAALLSEEQIASRNKSAHEDVVDRGRAGVAREWALSVLSLLVTDIHP